MQNSNAIARSPQISGGLQPVAPGVEFLTTVFVNVYFVRADDGSWVLIDTGLPLQAWRVMSAGGIFGRGEKPRAIVLTHGHFDHAGNALRLAEEWNVPIYAHRLEMPYLTGQSDYPPHDPTVGGALAEMSRVFPRAGYDFGERVRELPDDGTIPGLNEWRYLHTPGHTAGHISLFRDRDRVLIAGDALATVNQESPVTLVTLARELRQPPAPFTTDWHAARDSIKRLADLRPNTIAAGHGLPISSAAPELLEQFARTFTPPAYGRYVRRPVVADKRGVVSVPPPVADPVGRVLAGAAVAAAAGFVVSQFRKRRSRN